MSSFFYFQLVLKEEASLSHNINVLVQEISTFCDSPLERGDKGVCKFAATPPQPLFLEGSLKVAAKGILI